ncbi:MAG: hypothetical protein Tsb0018_05300 [Opitutales bacterium]
MYFNLTGVFAISYDSNVTNSGFIRKDDIILSPGIYLSGDWEATNLNTLSLTLGIAYDEYLKNSELSSGNNFLAISPDSEVSFTVFVGDATFTFFERLSYSIDGTNAFGLNPDGTVQENVADYGRFDNQFGVDIIWDLNDVQVGVGLARSDTIPTSSSFNFTERTEYSATPFVEANVNPNLTLGARGSLGTNKYKTDFNNNSTSFSLGPYIEWGFRPNWNLAASFDYVWYNFDDDGRNRDSSNPNGLEYAVTLSNTPSLLFEHRVFATRELDFGFISNTTTIETYGYGFDWQVARRGVLQGSISYQQGKDSGGLDPESYHIWAINPSFHYFFTSKFSAQLGYYYSMRSSNFASRTYPEHVVRLTLYYDF